MKTRSDNSTGPTATQRVVHLSNAILGGELGVIEGSRRICDTHAEHASLRDDADFDVFVAIESETDHLPIDEVRAHWSPDALLVKDREIRAAEEFYRESAIAACRRLIERFSEEA